MAWWVGISTVASSPTRSGMRPPASGTSVRQTSKSASVGSYSPLSKKRAMSGPSLTAPARSSIGVQKRGSRAQLGHRAAAAQTGADLLGMRSISTS